MLHPPPPDASFTSPCPSKPPLQKDGSNPAARGTDPSRDPPILGGGLAFVEARKLGRAFRSHLPPKTPDPEDHRPRTLAAADSSRTPPDPPSGLPYFPSFRRFRPRRGGSPRHWGPEPKKHSRGAGGLATVRCSGGCWFRKSCAGTRSGGGTHSSAVERLSCKQLVVGSIPTVSWRAFV